MHPIPDSLQKVTWNPHSRSFRDTGDRASVLHTASAIASLEWYECLSAAFPEIQNPFLMRIATRSSFCFVPLQQSQSILCRTAYSLDNEHCPYWLPIGSLDASGAQLLINALLNESDMIFLRRLPAQSSAMNSICAAAKKLRLPHICTKSPTGDCIVDIARTQDGLPPSASSDMKSTLRRQNRKLSGAGNVAFRITTSDRAQEVEMIQVLDNCIRLERQGWKGANGTAIGDQQSTLDFYTALVHKIPTSGRVAVYCLELDHKLIAFELCIQSGDHIDLLKIGYDESYRAFSPGSLLRMHVLEHERQSGLVRWYHMGRTSEWKRRWATDIAPLCTVRIFARGWRGRLAHTVAKLRHVVGRLARSTAREELEAAGRLNQHARPFK